MDLGVDPLVLMSQMVTLIMDIIAGTKWLKPNMVTYSLMATKLEVLLQTGGYLLLSSYVYDTCQGIAKQHKSLKPKLGGAVDET
ncbi:hypothetical protein HanIR_Chr16g0841671 [Helianthus annuus]|nr:hypothetical protein HanIR_Chr16g0841671 [Helianthus annuus]